MSSLLLAAFLAMAPADSSAQMEEAAALYNEGSIKFQSADYSGAIAKFTKALGIVSAIEGDDRTRLTLLYNIASAHEKAFSIDRDISHLRQALELYKRYREFAQKTGDIGEELDVESRILKLERRLRTNAQVEENRANAERAKRGVPPPPVTPLPDTDWKKPRNTGVTLVVVGGAATIGGVVMAVLGSRFESNAQAQVDKLAAMGVPMTDPAWAEGEAFVVSEKKKGNALMGTGVTMAVVGAAGIGVGAYFLAKSKKLRNSSVSAIPALSPGFAGIQVSGKF